MHGFAAQKFSKIVDYEAYTAMTMVCGQQTQPKEKNWTVV